MGIVAQQVDILYTITHSRTGTKTTGTDIHRIGTMIDGSHTTCQILGGGKQFESSHLLDLVMNDFI